MADPAASPPPWLAIDGDGCSITLRVLPRAGRTALAGTRAGALLVRVAAPPVEGAANDAVLDFLAERLGVPRRAVTLVSGHRSRDKRVRVAGVAPAVAAAALG